MNTLIISIEKVKYVGVHTLELVFNDAKVQRIDFSSFLAKQQNPSLVKYRNIEAFKSFELKHGDLVWGDYEMCFPIWDLYEGKI